MTPYEAFEAELNSRKPVEFKPDANVPTTQDSIKWAEDKLGHQLNLPYEANYEKQPEIGKDDGFKYTEDEAVSDTMDSIKTAEKLYGFN